MNSDPRDNEQSPMLDTDKYRKQGTEKQPPEIKEETARTIIEAAPPVFHETLVETNGQAQSPLLPPEHPAFLSGAATMDGKQFAPPVTASDKTSLMSDLVQVLQQPGGSSEQIRPSQAATRSQEAESEQTSLALGEVIGGKYRVLELLGRGGMGAVYKVEHLLFSHQKFFALKVLHADFAGRDMFRKRFQREVEIAMEFVHEHAVQIRDFGETPGGLPYFTMDFCSGMSLRQLLEQEKTLPVRRALTIARQVLSVLHSAHGKGIAHRDLKPENILVEQRHGEDHAMVLDFGIAKVVMGERSQVPVANLTQAHVVGTPIYMSPEQTLGEETDMRTDIYAMGVILYELVTGKPPFSGTLRDIFIGHVTKDVPRPLKLRKDLPAAVEDIILKAMSKKREQRFATAHEMMQAVDGVLNAPDNAATGRSWRIAATAMALLLLAVGSGYVYTKWVRVAGNRPSATPDKTAPDKPTDKPIARPLPPEVAKPGEPASCRPGSLARADLCRSGHYRSKGLLELHGSKWKIPLGAPVLTASAIADGVLYIGATYFENMQRLGRVFAIDIAEGKIKWSFATEEAVQSAPAIADGKVFFGGENGLVYALDAGNGNEVWKFTAAKISSSSPAVYQGVVYIGCDNHYLYALNSLDGKERWRFKTNNPIYSSPAVHEGVVYCAGSDSFCYAIQAADGRLKWKCSTGAFGASTPAVDGDTVYFTAGSYLRAIDRATGKDRWVCEVDGRSYSPAVADGLIYVVSRSVACIDLQGKIKWQAAFTWTRMPPCVAEGTLYFGADDHIVALDGQSGQERWRFRLQGLTGSLCVHDGLLFAGARDGEFIAIH